MPICGMRLASSEGARSHHLWARPIRSLAPVYTWVVVKLEHRLIRGRCAAGTIMGRLAGLSPDWTRRHDLRPLRPVGCAGDRRSPETWCFGWLLLVLLQLDLTGLVVRLQARPLPTEKIYLDPWCRLLLDHIRAFYRSPRFCKSESSVPQCVRNQLCYFAFVQKR